MQATERISLRTTPHAKAVIEQASQMMGVSVSHFILTTMYEKSVQLINTAPTIHLNEQDSQLAVQLLNQPKQDNKKLKELLQLSQTIVDKT